MAKEQTKRTFHVGDREILKVSVFADEFESFGISPEMSSNEAQTLVRAAAGLPERYRRGSTKAAIGRALRDASPEQLAEIQRMLSGQAVEDAEEEDDEE